MNKDKFDKLALNQKGDFVFGKGEFVGSRTYYGIRVALYCVNHIYIEVFYNQNVNEIDRIELIEEEYVHKLYLNKINLNL